VAGLLWNQWQLSCGTGGSFAVESVAGFAWNRWQDSPGIGGSFGVEYALKVKTRVKAGLRTIPTNHNETLVRVQKPTQGLKVKTKIKAGQAFANYGVGRF
jgi:hypothetical protein